MMHETNVASAIEVDAASKTLGTKTLWTELSFTAAGGEIVAITGASGAGKTTLLSCIGLLEQLDSGRVLINGIDVSNLREGAKVKWFRSAIGFLFQFHGLVGSWTVDQNLRVAQAHIRSGRDERARVLASLDLISVARRRVWTLSGGEQQRVALGRLMIRRPPIVLVDEPTSSLDEGNANVVMAILRELADAGSCVLVSTHDPKVVDWADREIRLGAAQLLPEAVVN